MQHVPRILAPKGHGCRMLTAISNTAGSTNKRVILYFEVYDPREEGATMDYEGQICRTPREKASFMLPVSVGCPYNRCKFCGLFKHLRYRVLPYEEVKAEVERVVSLGRQPRHVMLGDGNAFGVDTELLLREAELVRRSFPETDGISADSTITAIARKSDEELRRLSEAGIHTLYIGIETGLDDVLAFMHKEHDNAQAREQIARIHAAGIEYGAHIMCGVAGQGRGLENARATAAFLNETHPTYICNFTMMVSMRTELGEDVRQGRFVPASDEESLQEERELMGLLEGPVDFDGFTDSVELRVLGSLPKDRDRMCAQVDRKLQELAGAKKPVCA